MGLLAALLSVLLAVTALGEEVLWPGKGPGAAEESIRWTEGRLPEDGGRRLRRASGRKPGSEREGRLR